MKGKPNSEIGGERPSSCRVGLVEGANHSKLF